MPKGSSRKISMFFRKHTTRVRLSQDTLEDLLIHLRRISLATHRASHAYDLVNPEKVLYNFFRAGHAHTDLQEILVRLHNELEPQITPAAMHDAANPKFPWPPPYTQPLPPQPDDDAVCALAQGLSRQQLRFGILGSLNGLASAYSTLAEHNVAQHDDTQRLTELITRSWQDFWANYFNKQTAVSSGITDEEFAWVNRLVQAVDTEPESLGKDYLQLILPAIETGLTALTSPKSVTYVQLTRTMLEVSVLGAENESINPHAIHYIPNTQAYERPACRLAWGEIRWIARDMLRRDHIEAVYLDEGSDTVGSSSYNNLGGAISMYCPRSTKQKHTKSLNDAGSELTNRADCADYNPGDILLPERVALKLFSKVVTLCRVLDLILPEYEEENFEKEYFFRVGWCEEYDDLWSLYHDANKVEEKYWPERCMGQGEVQLQMSGLFVFDWCGHADLEWWGGYRDPEPTDYCTDCDPDDLYDGWRPTLRQRARRLGVAVYQWHSKTKGAVSRHWIRARHKRPW